MSGATIIEIDLLSGRYHAHVWGEAQFGMAGPEWPPSPWRLLRALASAWFAARPHPCSVDDRNSLLEALGRADAPQLWLPRCSFHEARYYQPVRLGAADRVLHYDHFAVPEGGRFWLRFNVELSRDELALLADLLRRLRYLGRSESRACLRLTDLAEPPRGVQCVAPRRNPQANIESQSGPRSVADATHARVLCTAPDFQAADLWSVRNGSNRADEGQSPHLVDTLLSRKMPVPCGARWIEYVVPRTILVHEIRPRVTSPAPLPSLDVAEIRFRLNRRIPIPVWYIVAVARAFREAAVKSFARIAPGQISRTLTGREVDGAVARGHEHAYYQPRLGAGGVTIEELIVRLPSGRLTRAELDALLQVERIQVGARGYPITVVPEIIASSTGPANPALRWCSSTPFLPPLRHRRGRDETCIEQQAIACADRLCGRRPVGVQRLPRRGGFGSVSSLLAHEYQAHDRNDAGRCWTLTRRLGFWLELTFDEPVILDRPLGADAHFGAGQFSPVVDLSGNP